MIKNIFSGWMLLSTINILSQAHPTLLDQMTAASLPSTLVKVLINNI